MLYNGGDEVISRCTLTTDLALSAIHDFNGGESNMASRIKQKVQLNGQSYWVTGNDIESVLNNYLKLIV